MDEIILRFTSADGAAGEIPVAGSRVSFGRGSEADFRFADDGLSRLHASVNRDGERLWILDENSTNGSFVNGSKVPASGTPLLDGDVISIGHQTKMTVVVKRAASAAASTKTVAAPNPQSKPESFPIGILLAILGIAVFVIGSSAAVIAYTVYGGGDGGRDIVDDTPYETETPESPRNRNTNKSPKPTASAPTNENSNGETLPTPGNTNGGGTTVVLPAGRFQDMSEADKDRYIAARAEKVARIIGNQASDPIPPAAVQEIKRIVKDYANRIGRSKLDSCDQGGWVRSDFNSVLMRATKTSPLIVKSFRAEGIEPQIGIYVAMIEGEHCPCLTSNTGAKGMFQFLASSAPDYGLAADQRCNPEQSAKAGAKYLKSLMARFGTAPDSVPLAIASFNAGQGNLSKNLDAVFSATGGQDRSFWTLIANKNMMEGGAGKQFVNENIRYVPKFFAAAIIGENPQDFGVALQPLSTYN